MTRSWRLPTALLLSVGLLLAFSSTALSYENVFEQQIIPDGADDPDYSQAAGGSSPVRSKPESPSSGIQDPASLTASHVGTQPDSLEDVPGTWRGWLIALRTGLRLGASLL